jgi:hypothetical protein
MAIVPIQSTGGSTRQWAPGSVNTPIATWPSASVDTTDDPDVVAAGIIESLNQALEKNDSASIAKLFSTEGYRRDHLALTWDLRTIKGNTNIAAFLGNGHNLKRVGIEQPSIPTKP